MRIQKDKTKVQLFLDSAPREPLKNVLLELRNGERLKPTSIHYFDSTQYGLCYAVMFATYSRYMLFNKNGGRFLDKTSQFDIVDIIEGKDEV